MAIQTVPPHPVPVDLYTIQEISGLLRQTGHPASDTTIRRWVAARGLYVEYHRRHGRRYAYASFTEIMEVHRDWVAGRS